LVIYALNLDEQFLQFSGLGFVNSAYFTVCRFIFVYLCVFCVFLFHAAYVLYYCENRVVLMGLKPNP